MKKLIMLISVASISLTASGVFAGDLDDGISKYTDDGMASWDDLGKSDKNIKFIVLNAKSKATLGNNGKNKVDDASKKSGDANMNSVVMGAGTNVHGDIIIIDQSKGSKTNIAD